MDFTIFNAGGIDHSPAPWVTRLTMVLDEPELADANLERMDRFWRVWHSDRSNYAPNLRELTLVLRPGFANGMMRLVGINKFLDHYRTHVEPLCTTKGLHIYLDCWSAIVDNTRYSVLESPLLLFTIEPEPKIMPSFETDYTNSENIVTV